MSITQCFAAVKIDDEALFGLASEPFADNMFYAREYKDLAAVQSDVSAVYCSPAKGFSGFTASWEVPEVAGAPGVQEDLGAPDTGEGSGGNNLFVSTAGQKSKFSYTIYNLHNRSY